VKTQSSLVVEACPHGSFWKQSPWCMSRDRWTSDSNAPWAGC